VFSNPLPAKELGDFLGGARTGLSKNQALEVVSVIRGKWMVRRQNESRWG